MSAEIQWLTIKKSSSFLRKSQGATFSAEAQNLTNTNTFKTNGLVRHRTIGLTATPEGEVVLKMRTAGSLNKVSKAYASRGFKRGSRRALRSVHHAVSGNSYRPELLSAALARTAALISTHKKKVVQRETPRTRRLAIKKKVADE